MALLLLSRSDQTCFNILRASSNACFKLLCQRNRQNWRCTGYLKFRRNQHRCRHGSSVHGLCSVGRYQRQCCNLCQSLDSFQNINITEIISIIKHYFIVKTLPGSLISSCSAFFIASSGSKSQFWSIFWRHHKTILRISSAVLTS